MADGWADQLRATGEAARQLSEAGGRVGVGEPLTALESAANQVAAAWSGSNLGYHADVYHSKFTAPPPGSHWSIEWGNRGMFGGSTGEWVEYQHSEVIGLIEEAAGTPDRKALRAAVTEDSESLDELRETVKSVLSGYLGFKDDPFLRGVEAKVSALRNPTASQAVGAMMRTGDTVSRDAIALGQGFRAAPHQEVLGEVAASRMVYVNAKKLAGYAGSAADHLDRIASALSKPTAVTMGTHVFIGHGHSLQWRVLKDFIEDRLGLPHMEFNRVPVAGVTNVARLVECLDQSAAAFLILTAEDERVDGIATARQNVIHEVGLFQGRLGFNRAIVMLEEGCAEFSNIQGLGQIRYPAGRIEAAFENVRLVLEREGMTGEGNGAA